MMMNNRSVLIGDNLSYLRDFPSDSVDLFYADPPYNKGRVIKNAKSGLSFDDRWNQKNDEDYYIHEDTEIPDFIRIIPDGTTKRFITFLAPRLMEMRRALKMDGSIYLQCDDTASGYIKVLMDMIFHPSLFMSQIVWKRTNGTKSSFTNYGRNTDIIFYYSNSKERTWNPAFIEFTKEQKKPYKYRDMNGRWYSLVTLTAPESSGTLMYEWKGLYPPKGRHWAYTKENMKKLEEDGLLVQTAPEKLPMRKKYLDESDGIRVTNLWEDVNILSKQEKVDYPTQKPLSLLDRIILTSSNENDLVVDPFCGSGTTLVSAEKNNRQWIGVDANDVVGIVDRRMSELNAKVEHTKYRS